jgi:hypothetical protein
MQLYYVIQSPSRGLRPNSCNLSISCFIWQKEFVNVNTLKILLCRDYGEFPVAPKCNHK